MTDDLVGRLRVWLDELEATGCLELFDGHIPTLSEAAARIEALEGALEDIAARNREREWTATDDNPESHWVERDGQYAKIARAALAKDKSDG